MNREQKAARKKERHDRAVANRLAKKRVTDAVLEEEDINLDAGDEIEEIGDDIANAPIIDETGTAPIVDLSGNPIPDPEDEDGDGADNEPEPDDQPEVAPVAEVKKDYGYPEVASSYIPMGVTTFDELDAERKVQEQSEQIRGTTNDVRRLVDNILWDSGMDPGQKAKAISALGPAFQKRVDSIIRSTTMEKDMDLLALEALIATDRRHTGLGERIGDMFSKAVLTSAGRKKLGEGQFALVTERNGQKIKKYPIHDKAHVRNALARAAQMMKRGGSAGADAKAALPKIHAAAKRMGIGMAKEGDVSSIIIEKDAKGDFRWVGWVSNNFIDWQGDIISKEAHQEYVDFLDKNPEAAPQFMTWHTPGTERQNPVDYWNFDRGFLIMSGKLEKDEAAALFKAKAVADLGMSLQGIGLRESDDPRVVTKYRLAEVSDLPLEDAANPFTDFSVIVKEVDMKKDEYLAALLGSKEKADAFMARTGMKQEALENAGVEQKAKGATTDEITAAVKAVAGDDVEVVVEEVEEEGGDEAPKAVAKAKAKAPALDPALLDQISKAFGMDDLSAFVAEAREAMEKVPVLESVIKDLQDGDDTRLAEKISPPAAKFAWMGKNRASEADDTKVKEGDADAEVVPGIPWLNEVTGTEPAKIQ
jgi:hypothetical protein